MTMENTDGSAITESFLQTFPISSSADYYAYRAETNDLNDVGTYQYVLKVAYDGDSYSYAGQVDITVEIVDPCLTATLTFNDEANDFPDETYTLRDT